MSAKPTYEELEKRNRELEKRLRIISSVENQNHSRKILDCSPSVIYTKDLEGHYTSINKQFENLSGLKSKEVIGKTDYELFPPQVAENSTKNDKQVIQAGTPKEFEEYGPVDGKMYTFISTKYPLVDEGGKIYGVAGLSSDIIESANVPQELREKDKLFRTAIKHSPIAIVVSEGIDQIVIMVNDRFTDLFGYTKEDVPDVAVWWALAYPDKAYREKISIRWTKAVEKSFSGQSHVEPMEVSIACKDGSLKEVSVEAATVGEVNIVTFVDMTEHNQNEEILHKSHEMLKRTEAIANIGSWEWDVQNDQAQWSEELFRIFGRHPAEGEPSFAEQSEFYVNEDFQYLKDAVERCAKQGTPYEIEVRAIQTDGEIRHCVSRGQPQYDENGKVFRVFGSFQDITDRKQTEEVLKLNYELLHIAGETAKFGGWSVDLEKNICTWSDAVADLHDVPQGYAPPVQEAINFYAPEWREKITQCFSACAKDGIPYDEVMEIITQKGKRVWVRATGRSVKNENDKIIKVQGSFQDITEHKLAEEALKASEKKYQSLFQNAQVALFRNRLSDGKVLEINERYAKMAGYSTIEECMAEFNAANAWVDPNGRKELLMILQENGFVSDYETEIIRKDGTNIWISFSATIFPEQGFLEGSIVEITERKRSEIEQEKLQAQLIQAQKMESVGRLAGGVAHDFNNMLSIILGNAEIIMEDIDPSNPLVTNLEEIYKAAERSTNLTRQLLAFARKQTIDPKVLNLNHILDDMLKMLKRLIGEDIDLTWQPAQNLCFVKIDPSQIDQILANLCINARDAIKSVGKITIETDNSSFDEAYCKEHIGFNPGDYVMMAVSDNGSGMDKKTLDNLFEPFFTTKNIGQGTGLGLATVYGIVKQNDGFINVYSEPGEGTTFKIYLPAYLETAASKPKNLKKTSLTGNETILLVEDETAILRMTRMMLERLGYTVLTASAPKEAISIVEASNINTIHLLMTDVVMPEMNGRDLSKKLLRMYPGLKCLFMSGYTANVIAHHGVLDTGVQFINKPFSKQDLATKLREVLDEAKGEKF
jgi:PAS domain S-box-containing protein